LLAVSWQWLGCKAFACLRIYICTMYVYTTMYNRYFNTRTINIVLFFLQILSLLPELAHKHELLLNSYRNTRTRKYTIVHCIHVLRVYYE